jgi:hypothetical protein
MECITIKRQQVFHSFGSLLLVYKNSADEDSLTYLPDEREKRRRKNFDQSDWFEGRYRTTFHKTVTAVGGKLNGPAWKKFYPATYAVTSSSTVNVTWASGKKSVGTNSRDGATVQFSGSTLSLWRRLNQSSE